MDGAEDVRDSGTKTWYSVGDKNYGYCGKREHSRVTRVKRILVTSMKMAPEYWNKVSAFWSNIETCNIVN